MATEFSAVRTDSIEVVDSNGNTQYILDADGLVKINSSNAVAQNFTNEESGSASFNTSNGGSNPVEVSHNLGTTPDYALVTASNSNANGDFYVSNKTSSTIELSYDSPPADDVTVEYEYQVAAR